MPVRSFVVRACYTLTFSSCHKHLQTPLSLDTQKLSLITPLLQVLSPVTGLSSCAFALCARGDDSLTDPLPSPDVAAGTYIVSVLSRDHVFDQVHTNFFRYVHLPLLNAMHAAPHRRTSTA